MRADGGQHGFELVAVVLVHVTGEFAGAGVFAALVGRHGEDTLAVAELVRASTSKSFNCRGDRSVSMLPVEQ